jgi:glyoxylase-like metal-dependent hydrolase (beta-lactamase superfamily II)
MFPTQLHRISRKRRTWIAWVDNLRCSRLAYPVRGNLGEQRHPSVGSTGSAGVPRQPRPVRQASLAYHVAVGDLTVTALNDSFMPSPAEAMTAVTPEEVDALNSAKHIAHPHISVNAFLVASPTFTVLIDTGCGLDTGPEPGRLIEAMASVGVKPSEISAVLMTHLHSDHVGGITNPEGGAAFPNAEIIAHEAELEFWLSDPPRGTPGPVLDHFNAAARVRRLMDRLRGVAGGEVLPGIYLNPEPGHTPGHSGYLLDSRSEQVLVWGDIVHQPQIQIARPDVGVIWDVDRDAAVNARRRTLDQVASDGMCIAGMHIDFHPFGFITRHGKEYEFVRRPWSAVP